MPKRVSFFEKLTGTVNIDHDDTMDESYDLHPHEEPQEEEEDSYSNEGVAQLAVDLYENPNEIILQTMVAGVRPEDLDVSINRETVTISGHREGPRGIPDEDYHQQELYWGSFSRKINLPAEIEVEEADAVENHGLLIITLPKINKERTTKLRIKSQ